MEEGHRITIPMIQKALSSSLSVPNNDINVIDFEVSMGAEKGDNFACVMKAVTAMAKVNGKEGTYHFMVKCTPLNEFRAQFLKEVSVGHIDYKHNKLFVFRNAFFTLKTVKKS
jgi:hypothetical protein